MSSTPRTGSTSTIAAHPQIGYTSVLVVVSDPDDRDTLVEACRAAGVSALGVGRVAEVEQWPAGQTVITDVEHLTPLWRTVGAAEVIVVVDSAEDGIAALQNGATGWLQLPSTSTTVAGMVWAAAVV